MSKPPSRLLDQPIRLTVTSETGHIPRVRAVVAEAARQVGLDDAQVANVALAIDEALANIIQHGYGGRPGQPIDLTIERVQLQTRVGLQMTICDICPQVALETIVGRDLEDVRPGGLGTHIIRSVMDEVEYSHRQPEGMQLRMIKLVADSTKTT